MKEEKRTFLEWVKLGSIDHRITVINLEKARKWRERQIKEMTDRVYSYLSDPIFLNH